MPQLSLYMDDATMESLRIRAEKEGLSLSKYAREQLSKPNNTWPDSFWKTYGAINDESFVVPSDIPPEIDGPLPNFD